MKFRRDFAADLARPARVIRIIRRIAGRLFFFSPLFFSFFYDCTAKGAANVTWMVREEQR